MRGRLVVSALNSDTRSTMVSSMGGNVGDDKGWDDKVLSTDTEAGSDDTDMVKMCKCLGVWKVMCKSVRV